MAGNVSPLHGKVARVEKNSVNMDFTEGWEITFDVDFDDISKQGDNWKLNLAGMGSWTGTFSGQVVLANTEQKAIIDNIITATPGVKLTDMQFTFEDAADVISGSIFINSVAITSNIGGKIAFTVSFTGDGVPTIAVA